MQRACLSLRQPSLKSADALLSMSLVRMNPRMAKTLREDLWSFVLVSIVAADETFRLSVWYVVLI